MSDVTRILNAMERGDAKAMDQLLPAVYEELRLLAAQRLSREPPGQTLQATALVHEAYLRLAADGPQSWENRGHFFAAAAEAMRRILVENARHKKSLRHGGGRQRIELDEAVIEAPEDVPPEDMMALDEALGRLADHNKPMADLVKLRAFAGLTGKQAAEVLGISESKACEDLAYARAWLSLEISKDRRHPLD
jgi:RNA polymerase sigma factor (TIGR02999 family)